MLSKTLCVLQKKNCKLSYHKLVSLDLVRLCMQIPFHTTHNIVNSTEFTPRKILWKFIPITTMVFFYICCQSVNFTEAMVSASVALVLALHGAPKKVSHMEVSCRMNQIQVLVSKSSACRFEFWSCTCVIEQDTFLEFLLFTQGYKGGRLPVREEVDIVNEKAFREIRQLGLYTPHGAEKDY